MSQSSAAQIRSRLPRIAEVAVERARLTVVPRQRQRAGRVPFIALVSVVLLGGVIGLLLFNTSMQQASFTSTTLEERATALAARQQGLEMDLDRLRDPQRIAQAAQRLGMVQACSPAFLELRSGKVKGTPCAATRTPFPINPRPPVKPAYAQAKTQTKIVPPATPGSSTPGNSTTSAGRGTAG